MSTAANLNQATGPSGPVDTVSGQVADHARRELVSLMSARVGDAFLRKPFYVDGDTDIVTLCAQMKERGIGDAVVRDGDRVGIFTTTDLRDVVLMDVPPTQVQARDVAHFNIQFIDIEAELADALVMMIQHRIRRILVRKGDQIVGLLGQIELMSFVANHSQVIALQTTNATNLDDLKAAAAQINTLIVALQRDGVRVEIISSLVGALNRQIFQRLWELLAPQELRDNSCLIVMGSEGRGEQIIKTDQDNGLILRDGFAIDGLEAITQAFTAALIDFGYPPCPGGVMLSRPMWCQPVSGFRKTLTQWIYGQDREGPMNLAIFLDATTVTGDPALLAELRAHLDSILSDNAPYLAHFAAAVQSFREDGGAWWSRIPGFSGRAAAEVDLKKLGLFPLVHGARTLALEYRLPELSTVDRLNRLAAEGRIEKERARDLIDAIRFMIGLKLSNNLRQIEAGRAPDNLIRLGELGTLERQSLRDSLQIVKDFRQFLSRHYRLDVL